MAWSFNPFTGNLDIVGAGALVFEGEVETFADLPEAVGDPAVGASFLVRTSTGVWLVNRRQAGIWIRRNNTGVRATDWEYGGDYPVNSVAGKTGNVTLTNSDISGLGTAATQNSTAFAPATGISPSAITGTAVVDSDARLSDSRTPTAHAASHAAGTKAQYNDQVAGMTENVFIRANNAGTAGNSITLTFNGVRASFTGQVAGMTENVDILASFGGSGGNITLSFDGTLTIQDAIDSDGTIELVSGDGAQVPDNGEEISLTGGSGDSITTVLSAWNAANPSNQATLVLGDGSQVPDNGEEITLSGGVAAGSDPFKNINQDLGTEDEVAFAKLTLTAPANGEVIRIDGVGGNGSDVGFAVYNTTGAQANSFFFNQASEYVGIGVGNGEGYIQANVPLALPNIKNTLVIRDGDGGQTATFDANANLTANRTYDLPDASGTLALTSDIPSTFAASAITSGVFDNARINFAAPSAIGSTTPSTGAFTTLNANNGTLTASAPVLDLSQTWNNAAVTFTGLRFNVTNTASASASNTLELQNNGTAVFFVRRTGGVIADSIICTSGGAFRFLANASTMFLQRDYAISWTNDPTAATPAVTNDLVIRRDAAATLAQRDGTNPQTFRLYNTTDAGLTNFERGFMRWSSNVLQIGTEKGGTGSARDLTFLHDGTTRLTINDKIRTGSTSLVLGSASRVEWGAGTIYLEASTAASPAYFKIVTGSTDRLNFDASGIIGFGGLTSLFPALKRSSTTLQVRLADDSAFAPLECAGLTLNGNLTASTRNIVTDTTTGTRIGTGTTQLLGFWNATPAVQPAAVADATDAATVITQLNTLLSRLRTIGIIAT